jgi:hypothetical protein
MGGACSMHGTDEKCVQRFGYIVIKSVEWYRP